MGRLRGFLAVCPTPGCPELVEAGAGLCDECEAERQRRVDSRRPSSRERGYGERWRAVARAYLHSHPFCECGPDCCPNGCRRPSRQVDHIDGLGPNGPRGYDPTNLQALAVECHSRKTVREQGGFGRVRQ